MYDLNASRVTFLLNNLFTSALREPLLCILSKSGRKDNPQQILSKYILNKRWKYAGMELCMLEKIFYYTAGTCMNSGFQKIVKEKYFILFTCCPFNFCIFLNSNFIFPNLNFLFKIIFLHSSRIFFAHTAHHFRI